MIEQTVLVVDDDDAVRDSIKELVESVGLKAQTFASAQSFLESYTTDQAGCLVLDVRMARTSGLTLQAKLKEMGSDLPIIFITGHGDIDMAVQVMKAGAVDLIQKPYHEQNLLDSINDALEIDVEKRRTFRKQGALEKQIASLTEREREVMDLLAGGHTNKAVAEQLGISPRTVEVHRQRVLEKCEVKSVPQLIRLLTQTDTSTVGA
ncbi:MAG: response regulator transcription factor [Acidiferrobacterales bacterium]